MDDEEEYIQLSSWAELITWLESFGLKKDEPVWNPKPKRKQKKTPPQKEGLF